MSAMPYAIGFTVLLAIGLRSFLREPVAVTYDSWPIWAYAGILGLAGFLGSWYLVLKGH